MSAPMATYRNPGKEDVEFEIGGRPGSPPTVYSCTAGGTVEGPAGYAKAFSRKGLVLDVGAESAPAAEAEAPADSQPAADPMAKARAAKAAKAKAKKDS